MDHLQKVEAEARAKLLAVLEKPFVAQPRDDGCTYDEDEFDPWQLFTDIYGSYSSEFDQCAIDVLSEMIDGKKKRHDLASEMFREMLCANDYCEYGTSPRACFWNHDKEILQQLIDRWMDYYVKRWVDRA